MEDQTEENDSYSRRIGRKNELTYYKKSDEGIYR